MADAKVDDVDALLTGKGLQDGAVGGHLAKGEIRSGVHKHLRREERGREREARKGRSDVKGANASASNQGAWASPGDRMILATGS